MELACQYDPETFFSDDLGDVSYAKRACRGCPLRDPCREYARNNHIEYGVWGGESRWARYRAGYPPNASFSVALDHYIRQARAKDAYQRGARTAQQIADVTGFSIFTVKNIVESWERKCAICGNKATLFALMCTVCQAKYSRDKLRAVRTLRKRGIEVNYTKWDVPPDKLAYLYPMSAPRRPD